MSRSGERDAAHGISEGAGDERPVTAAHVVGEGNREMKYAAEGASPPADTLQDTHHTPHPPTTTPPSSSYFSSSRSDNCTSSSSAPTPLNTNDAHPEFHMKMNVKAAWVALAPPFDRADSEPEKEKRRVSGESGAPPKSERDTPPPYTACKLSAKSRGSMQDRGGMGSIARAVRAVRTSMAVLRRALRSKWVLTPAVVFGLLFLDFLIFL
jgi:hypothetical protein